MPGHQRAGRIDGEAPVAAVRTAALQHVVTKSAAQLKLIQKLRKLKA